MEIFLDCLPCVLKQVLEASRMATDKPEIQAKIMEEALGILANYKRYRYSPDIVKDMHHVVKRLAGVSDPYKHIKERDIDAAKKIQPFLRHYLSQKQNALYWALKIAATGNIIDSAIYSNIDIEGSIQTELSKEFSVCDLDEPVPTAVEFEEERERREGTELVAYADSSVAQSPVSVNLTRADCKTGICLKPLIRRKPRSASRKPAAA